MPEPEVELYDDQQYQISSEASERRLAAARQRARRWRRVRNLAIIAVLLLMTGLVASTIAAARAPDAPSLIVTWPKSKVAQVLASDQIVLGRGGQPFEVGITNPADWQVTWKSGSAQQQEGNFKWAPTESSGDLKVSCHPIARGWERYFGFLWPDRQVSLASVTAKSGGNYARQITTGMDGVWVFPRIFALGAVSWDERALPILGQAAEQLPKNALDNNLAPLRAQPSAGLWQLVSNFDGSADLPSEDGTFASFHGSDIENSLPQIAARIVKIAPDASVKFVLRLDRDPAQGIVRIAFDGKRQRQAWIREKNQTTGKPLTGWEDGNFVPKAPAAPAT